MSTPAERALDNFADANKCFFNHSANRYPVKNNSIQINTEKLSFFDSETGEFTLLFLHGAFINKEYWTAQISHFAGRYRVVAVDFAGHGLSSHSRSDRDIQSFAADVSKLIEALDLKKVIMIGHSFGTDVMLEAVSINASKIMGLVEVDHLKNVGSELPASVIEQVITGLRTDFIATSEQFARQALVTAATRTDLVDRLVTDYAKTNHEVGISIFQNMIGYSRREMNLLHGLPLKLYLIHVDYTPTNQEALGRYLGNDYSLHIMKGTCHYPMVENPDVFNQILAGIFLDIESGQAN